MKGIETYTEAQCLHTVIDGPHEDDKTKVQKLNFSGYQVGLPTSRLQIE